MQQAIIDIACGISVNITPQKIGQYRKATAQEDNILMKPKEGKEYADKRYVPNIINQSMSKLFIGVCFLLFHSVTAFHYLPNRRYTFGNVKVTVVPPYELF